MVRGRHPHRPHRVPLVTDMTEEERAEKRGIVSAQLRAASNGIDVSCGGPGCTKEAACWRLFRCLYCSVFYCRGCAKVHFGEGSVPYQDLKDVMDIPVVAAIMKPMMDRFRKLGADDIDRGFTIRSKELSDG